MKSAVHSRARYFFLLLLSVVITACPQRTAVWVEPGSTADQLVFLISDERDGSGEVSIGAIRVYECGGRAIGAGAMWVVGPENGTAKLHRLIYGVTPEGFTSDQGPLPLKTGCYRIDISGTGKAEFQVQSDGSVVEREIGRSALHN